MKIVAYL
jgi:hypothetical protein